jgi:hypothetical protein
MTLFYFPTLPSGADCVIGVIGVGRLGDYFLGPFSPPPNSLTY